MSQRDWRDGIGLVLGTAVGAVAGAVLATELALGRLDLEQVAAVAPSGVLFITFFGYWTVAARNEGTSATSETSLSSAIHQVCLVAAFALLFVPVFPPLGVRFLPQSLTWIGIGLGVQAASAVLAVWARRHLGRNWSAAVRIAEGHALVTSGPYRRVRHPIYTGMLGMFVGTAIASGQVHAVLAVLLLAAAYWRKIGLEERYLGETFGAQFAGYRRMSWRLIPFVF